MNRVWLEFDDPELLGRACAAHLGRVARTVLERQAVFTLALSGGRSPLPLFRSLSNPGLFPTVCWQRTHLFFADERMVPPDHAHSNFASVKAGLLDHISLPPGNVHRMAGEQSPETAAREYEEILRAVCFPGKNGLPRLDLIVLGMGGDGHTASIFPGMPLPSGFSVATPVPPPDASPAVARLTLTPAMLDAAGEIVFLVQGRDKHPHMHRLRTHTPDIPAARVTARPQSWYICPPFSIIN